MPGWRTDRKIVVFESDDWGAVRMSSGNSINKLKNVGVDVDRCHFMANDALASESDLQYLFEILSSFRDKDDNSPVFTANVIMANPDFEKIQALGFNEYHYEHFTKTLAKYPEHSKSFEFWKFGMVEEVFYPQFHGREHINLARWMRDLKEKDPITLLGFQLGLYGISGHVIKKKRGSYLAAFDGMDNADGVNKYEIVKEGLRMFSDTFGYSSLTFIPPNYIWDDKVEAAAFEGGVEYIQSGTIQRLPANFGEKREIQRHKLGSHSKYNQTYLMRNCVFEPSSNPDFDWVDKCMSDISIAFRMRKPAVIDTHRVNYIGFINPSNRDRNLKELDRLLRSILKKWPDVEFLTSDQLGNRIKYNA